MLLGDVLARMEDEAQAEATLLALGQLALATLAAAAEAELTPGQFVKRALGEFVHSASDEDWMTLLGQMSRTHNPGQVLLRRVLSDALM